MTASSQLWTFMGSEAQQNESWATGPAHRSVDWRRLGRKLVQPVDETGDILPLSNGAILFNRLRPSLDFVFPSMPALPYVGGGKRNATEGASLPSARLAIVRPRQIKSAR